MAVFLQQVARKNQTPFFAISERRNIDRNFGDTVIEVFAEQSLFDQFVGALIRRTDDAHIDGYLLTTTDTLDHALLQEAQHFGLQRHWHVADFIEKQRTAAGHFNFTNRLLVCPCERTFLVSKEFGLQQILGDRRAIDRDEVLINPRTQPMQCARQKFFARSTLAKQQGCYIGRRDLLDHSANGKHALAGSDDTVQWRFVKFVLQATILKLELGNIERAIDE